jgi:glycerol 3-phosphate dehydrogenase (NAD(P)+) (EC 1.1.1.94)
MPFFRGPSFAREVVEKKPTAIVSASPDPELARDLQHLFNAPWFKVYTRRDVRGIELAGGHEECSGHRHGNL